MFVRQTSPHGTKQSKSVSCLVWINRERQSVVRPAVQRIRVLQLCFNLDSDGVKQQVEPFTHILLRGIFIIFICLYPLTARFGVSLTILDGHEGFVVWILKSLQYKHDSLHEHLLKTEDSS